MLTKQELNVLKRLNIVYYEQGKFHALPYGRSGDTNMTELQFAQTLLGYSMYKTKQKVVEYLNLLDKNCKYTS